MSNVRIVNDKKGKAQSWEAHYTVNVNEAMFNYDVTVSAYGADEKEARENLVEACVGLATKMALILE